MARAEFAVPGDRRGAGTAAQGQAGDLFSNQTINGFSFDVEVLYIAMKRGYKVVEVPIHWYYQSESKVHPIKDTIRMVRDMLAVRRNDRLGLYG